MATLTLTYTKPLNTSVQVGDTACYVPLTSSGQFKVNSSAIVEIGVITAINNPTSNSPSIVCNTNLPGSTNGPNYYTFFYKDNKANLSSILGYYAEITLTNSSTKLSELHSVACDVFESSK